MQTQPNILIVEDDPIIAEDISYCLEKNNYRVVDKCHTGNEAYWALQKKEVDIIILDINLESELNGIDLANHINEQYQLPFIYLTSYTDRDTLERAKQTRPLGYLVKPFDEKDLYTTLEIALFNHQNMRTSENANKGSICNEQLTTKENQILYYLNLGYTNQQIAEAEHSSINTIKTHLKNIYSKLDVSTRTQALAKVRDV